MGTPSLNLKRQRSLEIKRDVCIIQEIIRRVLHRRRWHRQKLGRMTFPEVVRNPYYFSAVELSVSYKMQTRVVHQNFLEAGFSEWGGVRLASVGLGSF